MENRFHNWVFFGETRVIHFRSDMSRGVTDIVSMRLREDSDPPFKPIPGKWEQKGKTWHFIPKA